MDHVLFDQDFQAEAGEWITALQAEAARARLAGDSLAARAWDAEVERTLRWADLGTFVEVKSPEHVLDHLDALMDEMESAYSLSILPVSGF